VKFTNIELMENVPVLTSLIRFAVPTVLGNIVRLIYNITDTYFIGLLDDYRQITVASFARPMMMTTNALLKVMVLGGNMGMIGNPRRLKVYDFLEGLYE
jgi:Na+-driven multidrug efflux pump